MTPVRVVIVTLDSHLAAPVARAESDLRRDIPGLELGLHVAAEWGSDPRALDRAKADIAQADVIIATMLFLDEHIQAILPDLQARAPHCDVIVGCMAAGEVIKLTRMGRFNMGAKESGAIALLKRLRGSGKKKESSGAHQMKMLKRLPKILKWIPGSAQDVRAYFLCMQYWMAGSDDNVAAMVRYLVDRYAAGPRAALKGTLKAPAPAEYPETGLYHPGLPGRGVTDDMAHLESRAGFSPPLSGFSEAPAAFQTQSRAGRNPALHRGRVGVLLMRAYVLAGDTAHYDGVIAALEARGLEVIPAFAAGLDSRPAIDAFFRENGETKIDALVSLTGFSLVGGPAYNDTAAAEEALAALDVPYIAAHALEFQTLEDWRAGARGLSPVEATMMVAIPEIDGATNPIVYGGRSGAAGADPRAMNVDAERADRLADRVAKLVDLRCTAKVDRKVAVVLYGFPPNAGAVGTAAHLGVFESLHNTLKAMGAEGYTADVPDTVDALREAVLHGNAEKYGQQANVAATLTADDMVAREPHLAEIEAAWGPAPGKIQTNGRDLFVLGAHFGNVFVGIQPAFGYEGDPMRLLFEQGFAPTHAFSAFYRYLREDFGAHVALHFGMHGAFEFMPGKQCGMSAECWPDRLIGDLPNVYLYAMNNPSEGALAKRRGAAVTVTHLTPPVAKAGLYKGLVELKASLDRWRTGDPSGPDRADLEDMIRAQAGELDLPAGDINALWRDLIEYEQSLIPHGLHVVGRPVSPEARADLLATMGEALPDHDLTDAARALTRDHETPAILHALGGGFIRPVPGADLVRAPQALPTGRNLHAFDPFRMPSAFAMQDGAKQAERLLQRHLDEGNSLPRSIALVLWGADNLKTEGGPIAQAMALMGARPRFDSYGRLCGAELLPLEELGRPRIDVVMTLSGIFRDLLPLQTRMLAEAAWLAATADEPADRNHIRAHTLAHAEANDTDFETAALRVFSNADGAYGANVNQMVDAGAWDDEDELADVFQKRKCFAYGRTGEPAAQPELMQAALRKVDLAYQNLESVELGVTTIDHYFDTLGGISRAVTRARGEEAPVYISDQTRGDGKIRTLNEQVALETRTRALNPKWYEGMLSHGHEGVRQIEAHVTNSVGWSATTGQVDPWVYQRLTETFLLDPEMRKRLADLNPQASARMASRLIEAQERAYWDPDEETLEALRAAGDELEDRLEGVASVAAE